MSKYRKRISDSIKDSGLCPVCVLLGSARQNSALADSFILVSASERNAPKTEPSSIVRQFENYEVISRTSAMTYRPGGNRDLRSIASELRVASVVEGTVRTNGDRIRITVRLVDGRTDETFWSESYDRDLANTFSIQSEIARAVAHRLSALGLPRKASVAISDQL